MKTEYYINYKRWNYVSGGRPVCEYRSSDIQDVVDFIDYYDNIYSGDIDKKLNKRLKKRFKKDDHNNPFYNDGYGYISSIERIIHKRIKQMKFYPNQILKKNYETQK